MAQKVKFPESKLIRLERGTLKRLADACGPKEDANDLIRTAIEIELKRREEERDVAGR